MPKMYFVKFLLCAFLIELAQCISLEVFGNSTDPTEFSPTCCFDLFEKEERDFKHRSVVILLPDASSDFQVESSFVENSRWKNPWSVKVWQLEKYWIAHDAFPSRANENRYILFSDQTENETAKAFIGNFCSSKHINDWRSSSSICISNGATGSNAVQVRHGRCSLVDISCAKKHSNRLSVAGVESAPFAYYDTGRGNWKGIDISLITTVAKKLVKPMFVQVLTASEFGPQSVGDRWTVGRYDMKVM